MNKNIKARVAENFLEMDIRVFINRREAVKNPKRTYRLLMHELEDIVRDVVYDPGRPKQKTTIYLGTRTPREIRDLLRINR